jgi:uncharacterized protein (TIGR00369 family)
MTSFDPVDSEFADRVRESFGRQALMKTIGALLTKVAPGEVHVELPFRTDLTQQHGFLHAAVITAIVDTACGFAALTLAPREAAVLTIEYKVNFLSPGFGERITARARVLKRGRAVTICAGDVYAQRAEHERHIATMIATIANVIGRPDLVG